MRKIDLLIAGVIVAAVVFSFVGVATYEAEGPAVFDYDVTFSETEHDVALASKTAPAGPSTHGFTQPWGNVSKVVLSVTIDASGQAVPRGQEVKVRITVTPKGAPAQSAPRTFAAGPAGGSVVAPFEFTFPKPNTTDLRATNDHEAAMELQRRNNESLAKGEWTVRIELDNPNPAPVQETFTVRAQGKATTYMGAVQVRTPPVNR